MQQGTTWLDYVTAFSTGLAALGTLAAVLMTLYLGVWRAERRRPSLEIDIDEETEFGVGWNPGERKDDDVWGVPFLVKNRARKATAHEVEVLISVATKETDTGGWYDWIVDTPLVWRFSRTPDGEGLRTVDIPSGITRKVFVGFIGEANVLFRTLWPGRPMPGLSADDDGREIEYGPGGHASPASPPIACVLATYPFTQDDPFWLWRDEPYRLRLTVTCEERDAMTFEVFVTFTFQRRQPGEPGFIAGQDFIQPVWSDLTKVRT